MTLATNTLRYWLPAAVAATVLTLLVAVAVQQSFRLSANDPQIQVAEDAAAGLTAGGEPRDVVGGRKVDVAQSLALFTIVFDDAGRTVASGGQLDGQTPALPPGVFDDVRSRREARFTWQPASGVRLAAVVVHYAGAHPGFVLAARSLGEVEQREDQLRIEVILGWIGALGSSLIVAALLAAALARVRPR